MAGVVREAMARSGMLPFPVPRPDAQSARRWELCGAATVGQSTVEIAMPKIARPTYQGDYPKRANDIDMHLEDHVGLLIAAAVEAGWSRQEVLASLIRLTSSPRLTNPILGADPP